MKKKSIRFFALICTAFILFSNCASPAMASENQLVSYAVEGGYIYFDPETGAIVDCDTGVTKAVIPEKINDVAVTCIGDDAFTDCKSLTSVTIPDGVTGIGSNAFNFCNSLTNVTIPDSVSTIGDQAFYYCENLTSVTIPDGVTRIEGSTFFACARLKSVTIPDSVTYIGMRSFSGCSRLTSIAIPDGVTLIGDSAFYCCESLTSITLPSGITSIGSDTFGSCSSLMSITIPDGVTGINTLAFAGCSGLTSITIPDSVTYIGSEPFQGCDSLRDVYYAGSKEKWEEIFYKFNYTPLNANIHYNSTGPDGETGGDTGDKTEEQTRGIICQGDGWAMYWKCIYNIDQNGNKSEPRLEIYISGVDKNDSWKFSVSDTDADIAPWLAATGIPKTDFTKITVKSNPENPIYIAPDQFAGYTGVKELELTNIYGIGSNAFMGCVNIADIYYAGTKAQWDALDKGTGNNDLNRARLHCSGGSGAEVEYGEFLCDGETIMLFGKKPSTYDPKMAEFAVTLSQKTYEGKDAIESFVRDKGFNVVYSNNYGGSLAFTVATKPYYRSDDGEQTDILLIAAQGSTNPYELLKDATAQASASYRGYSVYDIVRDFRNAIVEGLSRVTEPNRSYKVLVTGHSLGGAAANLVAAQLTDGFIAGVQIQEPKSDVFCYTFGAINSIDKDTPVQSGYENIHNVYNEEDTFSPKLYGGWLPSGMGRGFGKFGHMDLFSWDYRSDDDRAKWDVTQIFDALNHKIDHYVDVVSGNDPYVDISRCYSTCMNHSTYRYSLVGCPVDVDVYCEGKLVGRVKNNVVDTSVSTIEIIVEGACKYIIYPDDRQYDLQITAFDDGRMLFVTQDSQDGEPTLKVIAGVELTAGKKLSSQVGGSIEVSEVKLYVVDDDGEPVAEVQEDGSEVTVVPPDPTPLPPPYIPDIPVYDPGDIGGEDVNGGSEEEPGEGPDAPEFPFTDVPADAYYADAVKWAVERKVTNGTTTTTFSPDKFCTRGEIVTFLWRAYGSPEPVSTENPFADVKPTDFFYKAVLWAAENDVTSGIGEDTFSPNDPCNRAEAVTFQYRAAKKPAVSGGSTFSDVSAGTWYSDAVSWAVEEKITNGTTTTTFSPDKICTRGDIVTFLWRDIDK